MPKKKKTEEVESETSAPVYDKKSAKPYAEEAHEFLKVLGKWVELKKTFPSGYVDYHEATRKFLEDFKEGKKK